MVSNTKNKEVSQSHSTSLRAPRSVRSVRSSTRHLRPKHLLNTPPPLSGIDAALTAGLVAGFFVAGFFFVAGLEAGFVAGFDAGLVAGFDAGLEAGFDAGLDAGLVDGFDAGLEAGFDAGLVAGFDAGFEAGFDAGLDAGLDAGFLVAGLSAAILYTELAAKSRMA
jgi:Essential protein Yae1, N terminal